LGTTVRVPSLASFLRLPLVVVFVGRGAQRVHDPEAVETVVPDPSLTEGAELGEPRLGTGVLARRLSETLEGQRQLVQQRLTPGVGAG
jgi:hypothetical protein